MKCGCPRNTYGWLKTWFLKTNVPKFSKRTWYVEELEMLPLNWGPFVLDNHVPQGTWLICLKYLTLRSLSSLNNPQIVK
jgi:hypothetical protein